MAVATARADSEMVGRLWGSAKAMVAAGQTTLQRADSRSARRQLAQARAGIGAVPLELAIRAGSQVEGRSMLAELRTWIGRQAKPTRRRTLLRHGELTAREVDVLTALGDGLTDAQIAAALGISAKTVAIHVAHAKLKLGAATRVDLALSAHQLGPINDSPVSGRRDSLGDVG